MHTLAQPYIRARHSHRHAIAESRPDELFGDEAHEPLDAMPRGLATSILERIDEALARGEQGEALLLERLLPPTLGAEPAVVDRLATLRLLEGDAITAGAALGACPQSTPRLDLLRMAVAVQRDDAMIASQTRGIAASVLAALLFHIDHVGAGSDPAAAVCLAVAGRRSPVATLTAALIELERLLDAARGPLAARVLSALRGVACDLGLGLRPTSCDDALAITPSDSARLRLRAA